MDIEAIYQYFKEELPSILSGLPLNAEGKKIAIYGIGLHTERLLEKYRTCVGEIKTELIFIDSYKKSLTEKYNGCDVYNIKDIGDLKLDMIIISSSVYEEEMYHTIKNLYGEKFEMYRLYENRKEDIFLRDGIYLPSILRNAPEEKINLYERMHAFLIVAHNEFDLLEKELELLDNDNADIYLHIDARCKDIDLKNFEKKCKKSRLYIVKRIKVTWGGHSQIKCTLNMLKEATKKGYRYYHLLSGVDLPLKTPKEINSFFEKFDGYEFMNCGLLNPTGRFVYRIKYYHFLRNIYGRNNESKLKVIEDKLIDWQKKFNMNRIKGEKVSFHMGSCWFSITHKMAMYILDNRRFIRKYCYHALCSDEIFVQSLAMRSPYAKNIIPRNFRHIDWDRGNPYVFKNDDFEEIMSSNNLFARKFSSKADSQIIDRIYNEVKRRGNIL